jgi:hypothetical protein
MLALVYTKASYVHDRERYANRASIIAIRRSDLPGSLTQRPSCRALVTQSWVKLRAPGAAARPAAGYGASRYAMHQ